MNYDIHSGLLNITSAELKTMTNSSIWPYFFIKVIILDNIMNFKQGAVIMQ